MKRSLYDLRLQWSVAAFCAWQASDLLAAWRHSPYDRLAGLSFLIWIFPVLWTVGRGCVSSPNFPRSSAVALLLAITGRLVDVNALLCIGLAVSLWAIVPARLQGYLWLTSSLAWMPAFSWLAQDIPMTTVAVGRLACVTAASACWWSSRKTFSSR